MYTVGMPCDLPRLFIIKIFLVPSTMDFSLSVAEFSTKWTLHYFGNKEYISYHYSEQFLFYMGCKQFDPYTMGKQILSLPCIV